MDGFQDWMNANLWLGVPAAIAIGCLVGVGIVMALFGVDTAHAKVSTMFRARRERRQQVREAARLIRAQRRAHDRVDGLLHEAHVKMEEAAGWRQKGERTLSDDIFGSWSRW